jgi:hypothetical protein
MTQIKLKPEDYKTSPFDVMDYFHDEVVPAKTKRKLTPSQRAAIT